MKGYPRWTTKFVFAVTLASLASGLLLLPTALELRQELELSWRLSGADRIWVAALHVMVGWGVLWMMGAVWSIHMRAGWRRRQLWRSGLLLVGLCLLLAVTALGLYYVGDEALLGWTSLLHWLVGITLMLALLLHYWRARARRRHHHHHDHHHGAHT